MGVTDLWQILYPTRKEIQIKDLHGEKVAVDLSIWIYESLWLQESGHWHPKRMMVFKVLGMLTCGVRPVFILEGECPKLKHKTILNRRRPGHSDPMISGHGSYTKIKNQWVEFLDAVGLPYIVAPGEAEEACAKLNAIGVVDACVTEDGDCLLFGATKVYRHFTCDKKKESRIELYEMCDIECKLGLNQNNLVAMALLLGCDYNDHGVNGIGRETVMKFISENKQLDLLERFTEWRLNEDHYAKLESYQRLQKPRHCTQCGHPGSKSNHHRSGCITCGMEKCCDKEMKVCECEYHLKKRLYDRNSVELYIRCKAILDKDFPSEEVIKAFLKPNWGTVHKVQWTKPIYHRFKSYLQNQMHWTEDDIIHRLLPIYTMWDMVDAQSQHTCCTSVPKCIVKERSLNFVEVYEVQWKFVDGLTADEESLVSLEEKALFTECFPETVTMFNTERLKIERAKSKKKRKATSQLSGHGNLRINQMFKVRKKLDFNSELPSTSNLVKCEQDDSENEDKKNATKLVNKAEFRRKLNFTPDKRLVARVMERQEKGQSCGSDEKDLENRMKLSQRMSGQLTPLDVLNKSEDAAELLDDSVETELTHSPGTHKKGLSDSENGNESIKEICAGGGSPRFKKTKNKPLRNKSATIKLSDNRTASRVGDKDAQGANADNPPKRTLLDWLVTKVNNK